MDEERYFVCYTLNGISCAHTAWAVNEYEAVNETLCLKPTAVIVDVEVELNDYVDVGFLAYHPDDNYDFQYDEKNV